MPGMETTAPPEVDEETVAPESDTPGTEDLVKGKLGKKKGYTYQDLFDLIKIAEESGLGVKGANRARKKLKKAGFDPDAEGMSDVDPSDMNQADWQEYMGLIKPDRQSLFRKKVDQYVAGEAQKEAKRFFDDSIQPRMDDITMRLDEMLKNPVFDGEELAALRTDITDTVKRAETSRMRRVSSVLGVRGFDPGTATGAAMLDRVVGESDALLTDALRKQGIDIAGIENQTQMQELGFAQNLLNQQTAAKVAAEQGSLEQLLAISDDLGGLFEAINMLKMLEEDGSGAESLVRGGLTVAGTVVGAYFGGPAGATAGGTAGSAAGDAIYG